MKIKGVRKDKKHYGDIVELSSEEKAKAIVQEGIAQEEEEKGYRSFLKDLNIKELVQASNGSKLKKLYENNLYKASGTATLVRRRMETNALLEPKSVKFKIEFHDVLTHNGVPDLKITKLEYTV